MPLDHIEIKILHFYVLVCISVDFFFNMGGSIFFSVESKTCEFSVEEGGMFY